LRTLDARAATAAQTLIGLEASGHLWENLEAALVGAGYRVLVLNPLQTRRYRDVVRRKAKTDDIGAPATPHRFRQTAPPWHSLRETSGHGADQPDRCHGPRGQHGLVECEGWRRTVSQHP
jgi:Transposase